MNKNTNCDVAIIGGGPAGSTAGSLLRKYMPELDVIIIEKETFPRDHVGESQLPPIGAILDEMGCWNKVEEAGFPIKIGATYRWGKNDGLWDFDFVPADKFVDAPRPAAYEGQRTRTALQVDRAKYDDILLRHAESLGCQVRESTSVKQIEHVDRQVKQLILDDGSSVQARWYLDASGHTGVLRRALDIEVHYPSNLKNIAIWDYWENAKWADEIGVGGTRVQVLSHSNGWMWFIPLGPTRTSIGLITTVDHYKSSGKSTEELYSQALASDQRLTELVEGASRRDSLETTTDWSFLADSTAGSNWFLIGEAAGFADPILAAGMTLAHGSARECAYTICELVKGDKDESWLKGNFDRNQRDRIKQHIRFADFWYAANGQFSDLKDHCQSIAKDAGLSLNAEEAWQWIAQGGFTADIPGQATVAGFFDLASAKQCAEMFTDGKVGWSCDQKNVFRLNLNGATETKIPIYRDGKVIPVKCFERDGLKLPITGISEAVIAAVERSTFIDEILKILMGILQRASKNPKVLLSYSLQALEAMVSSGWIDASYDPTKPVLTLGGGNQGGQYIKLRE